jgi:hypothetical protein
VNVSNITKDSFDINQDIDQDTIFIYGGLINDFKTINYQSITITNLGAIQELDKKNLILEDKIKGTDDKIKTLEETVMKQNQLLEQLLKKLM